MKYFIFRKVSGNKIPDKDGNYIFPDDFWFDGIDD